MGEFKMNDQEIIDNAPNGNFKSVLIQANATTWMPTDYRSLADIKRIVELDKSCDTLVNVNFSLTGDVLKLDKRIAELEKERDELKIQVEVLTYSDKENYQLYSDLLFSPNEPPKNLELHNFAQQAKGAMDYIEWGIVNIDPEYCEFEDCAREYGELLIAGKLPIVEALREQGFHFNGQDFK
jgi:hypothetical protein